MERRPLFTKIKVVKEAHAISEEIKQKIINLKYKNKNELF